MGMDSCIYVETTKPVTDEEIEAANAWLYDRRIGSYEYNTGRREDYFTKTYFGVEFDTYWRLWAPGYERGPWPLIHATLKASMALWPDATVYYGGDITFSEAKEYDGYEVTEERLQEYWDHWVSDMGNDYQTSIREWTANRAKRITQSD